MECNPDDVTAALLATYRAAGVNRLSLGVQSMVPHVLAALGPHARPGQRASRRGAGPRRRLRDVQPGHHLRHGGGVAGRLGATVRSVLALEPPHVSAYGLTVEAGTPLALDPARYPDDDDQAAKYEVADTLLTEAGLASYEISNWARPGHECRHNLVYWCQGDYLGFGCAAHSHRAGRRWWNVRTPERYIGLVEGGRAGRGGRRGPGRRDPAPRRPAAGAADAGRRAPFGVGRGRAAGRTRRTGRRSAGADPGRPAGGQRGLTAPPLNRAAAVPRRVLAGISCRFRY